MATIRVIAESDVPAVVELVARVYPDKLHLWRSRAECESYYREMLFDNPWRDPELPSWVAEEDGRICGFYAVLPRPMLLRGRTIRVAVGCQFMVDPKLRNGLTWLQLAQACLSGPQDLTLTDGATDLSRRLWIKLGGTAPPLYNLYWTRPLRPARYALSLLEERSALPRPLTLAARPLGAVVDALAARLRPNRFMRVDTGLEETLDAAAMLAHLPDVMQGNALQPIYGADSLAWLLDQASRKTFYGKLRARAVLDGGRRLIGWYLYYLRAGGVSEVVQLAACNGSFDCVLQQLLADAWRQGAAAVQGRLDPRHLDELSSRHCWLRRHGAWTLVHSRDAEVKAAIEHGEAFISRLEAEWWTRFLGA